MRVYPVILNPPSDLEIMDAYYRVNSGGVYTNFTSLNCYKTGEGGGNYSCAFSPEKSIQTTPGDETRTIELKMSLAYTIDGALVVKNVSDNSTFTVKRAYSEAVSGCLQQQASLDKKIKKLKSDKTLYTVLAVILLIVAVIFWILYIICYIGCSTSNCQALCYNSYVPYAKVATAIGACALTFVLSKLESIDSKMKQLQSQKQSICVAEGFGALSGATSSSGSTIYSLGKIVSSVVCAMAVSGSISSWA
jgi:hypothetical protein